MTGARPAPPNGTAAGAPGPRRVVVLSHGHPSESPAGGEIAAYEEFRALAATPGIEATLIAASANGLVPVGEMRPLDGGAGAPAPIHVVGFPEAPSWQGEIGHLVPADAGLVEKLCGLAPDELRIHHFFRIGIETLLALRVRLPRSKLVFTAHEFLTLCEANGHMVKEHTGALCHRAAPLDCAWCFPRKGVAYFEERESALRLFLDLCDTVEAPSRFLAGRLVEWGVPSRKVAYVPAVPGPAPTPPGTAPAAGRPGRPEAADRRVVFGFLGHVVPHKGILLLLDAVARLPARQRDRMELRIHGLLHPNIGKAFREAFDTRLRALEERVCFEGPYDRASLPRILSRLDWLVFPSLWWENAPLVLREASSHGVPVITADVGGMAEHLAGGAAGQAFAFGSVADLAHVLGRAIDQRTVPPADA